MVLAVGPDGRLEPGFPGDDVAGRARVERADRDDRVVADVELAGDHDLEVEDDLGADDDRIDAGVGIGAVTAFGPDVQGELVAVGPGPARA